MSADTHHEIQLALRTAAGHERAAREAEESAAKTYEMKMKSAGASAYAAFVLAAKAAPEYQGRKLDEKAIARIYQSTKARPWWDQHLAKVKVSGAPATREWSNRVIQWHVDPEAAVARRARRLADDTARRKSLKERKNSVAHGPRGPQARSAPSTATMRKMAEAGAAVAAPDPRTLPSLEKALASVGATAQDCMGEINRIKVAVARLSEPAQFNEAVELLKAVARDVEKLA